LKAEIPPLLLRGDFDPDRRRRLSETWPIGFLATRRTFDDPNDGLNDPIAAPVLEALFRRHALDPLPDRPFLSFTTCEWRARLFAANGGVLNPNPVDEEDEDAYIIRFDTSVLVALPPIPEDVDGIFRCQFRFNSSSVANPEELTLIHTRSILVPWKAHELERILGEAEDEWLLLPSKRGSSLGWGRGYEWTVSRTGMTAEILKRHWEPPAFGTSDG